MIISKSKTEPITINPTEILLHIEAEKIETPSIISNNPIIPSESNNAFFLFFTPIITATIDTTATKTPINNVFMF